jgi:hypothetical protein
MNMKDYIKREKNVGNKYIKYDEIKIKEKNINNLYGEKDNLKQKEKIKYNAEGIKICRENEDGDELNINEDNNFGIIKKIDNKNEIIKDKKKTLYIKKDLFKNYKQQEDNIKEDVKNLSICEKDIYKSVTNIIFIIIIVILLYYIVKNNKIEY